MAEQVPMEVSAGEHLPATRKLPEHAPPLPAAPHDPTLYDGDEEEEEDPYEMYVLRRPHERSSTVVPQLVKQPEMADTRLRYRRIPAEARSGSLCSLGNHFPRRFEFPNRPSLLESLTSDDESAASLFLASRNSSARDLSDSMGDLAAKRRSTVGHSELAAASSRAPPKRVEEAVASADLEPYVSVADEIEASTPQKRRRKKRAPRPPLPKSPDSFGGTINSTSIVGNDLAAAFMSNAKPNSGKRSPRKNSLPSSPVTTPDSSAKNEDSNSGDSGNLTIRRAGRESPPRVRTPVSSPRSLHKKSEVEQLEPASPNSDARKSRLRRSRLSSPEIKRFNSHVSSSKNDLAPTVEERDLRRRCSAGSVYYSTRGSPAPFTEWEGRKICAPAVLSPSRAKDFLLMVEEPVMYSRQPSKTKSRTKKAGPEAEPAAAGPSSSTLPRKSKRLSAKRKKMYRSSMRFRRSLASHTRSRRSAKARERAATGAATRRSAERRKGGVDRDRELSVSTHVRSTPEQTAVGPANALRKVFQALRLTPRPADSRAGPRW